MSRIEELLMEKCVMDNLAHEIPPVLVSDRSKVHRDGIYGASDLVLDLV